MRRAWMAMLVLAGCSANEGDGDGFPVTPGGGGGAGTPRDAGPEGRDAPGDGASTVSGRVCVTGDLRALASCAPTGAGGLTVTLGGETATTADDGAFTIAAPASADAWRVTGSGIVPSVMAPQALAATPELPVITTAAYEALIAANLVALQGGEGSVVVRITRGGAPLADATVSAAPPPANPTFYDGADALAWETTATGPAGIAWLPGIATGAATIAVTPAGGAATDRAVTVEDQAITFVTLAVP